MTFLNQQNRLRWIVLTAGLLMNSISFAAPPNVVFILADDLGHGGLHCYGTPWLETPHIDKLCSQGMKFTKGLSAYPTCQPINP